MISNLLRNALKFTNEGDSINVTISTKDAGIKREVIVRISDTGSGIDPRYSQNCLQNLHQNPIWELD